MKTLNSYYVEAEKIGGQSYLEGCLACATAYIIFLCMETRYEKVRAAKKKKCPRFGLLLRLFAAWLGTGLVYNLVKFYEKKKNLDPLFRLNVDYN